MKLETQSAQESRELGKLLGERLRAGDLVLLHGELGAGKTTFTQGIAEGLQVAGRVVSPTFIVARVHESAVNGPQLIHVDAYRIEDGLDLETLDLDTSLPECVTVIEWGAGKAEVLSDSRLEIHLRTSEQADSNWAELVDESRIVEMIAVGDEWTERLEDFSAALEWGRE